MLSIIASENSCSLRAACSFARASICAISARESACRINRKRRVEVTITKANPL
jgi:hypothetical protein